MRGDNFGFDCLKLDRRCRGGRQPGVLLLKFSDLQSRDRKVTRLGLVMCLQVCRHRASFLWSQQIWQGFCTNETASIPGVKVVTTTAHGLPHETTTRGKQPDALITVPQPPGLYGPLLYPTSTTGTAGLTLGFTVVHPVGRRGTEYACDENALHRAYRAKVTKHHEWLQAKNYWFVPVVAATSGALHPETLRRLYNFARLNTDAAEQHAVANSLRSPLTPEQLCQRRGATFARLRMEAQLYSLRASATRLTGKHWAAPYASSLFPRSRAGLRPMPPHYSRDSLSLCPGIRRPRACVPLVVWAWDFFLCGFLASVSRPPLAHCFSLCDLRLFVNERMLLSSLESLSNATLPRGYRQRTIAQNVRCNRMAQYRPRL
jgi:hypothetical protein